MEPQQIKKSIQAIIEGFAPLAEKLQQPTEKIWEWAIKNNYVQVFNDFLGILIILGFGIAFYKLVKYGLSKDDDSNYNHFETNGFLLPITVILGVWLVIVVLVFCFILVPDIISRLINPEFNVLKDIIQTF